MCAFNVTRLPFIAIVGDVRDLSNPNYCAIGMMRAARMAEFRAEALCRKIFSRWAGAAAEPTPQVPDPEHAPAQSSESDDEFDEVGEEDSAERSDSLSCVITSERRQ